MDDLEKTSTLLVSIRVRRSRTTQLHVVRKEKKMYTHLDPDTNYLYPPSVFMPQLDDSGEPKSNEESFSRAAFV